MPPTVVRPDLGPFCRLSPRLPQPHQLPDRFWRPVGSDPDYTLDHEEPQCPSPARSSRWGTGPPAPGSAVPSSSCRPDPRWWAPCLPGADPAARRWGSRDAVPGFVRAHYAFLLHVLTHRPHAPAEPAQIGQSTTHGADSVLTLARRSPSPILVRRAAEEEAAADRKDRLMTDSPREA